MCVALGMIILLSELTYIINKTRNKASLLWFAPPPPPTTEPSHPSSGHRAGVKEQREGVAVGVALIFCPAVYGTLRELRTRCNTFVGVGAMAV